MLFRLYVFTLKKLDMSFGIKCQISISQVVCMMWSHLHKARRKMGDFFCLHSFSIRFWGRGAHSCLKARDWWCQDWRHPHKQTPPPRFISGNKESVTSMSCALKGGKRTNILRCSGALYSCNAWCYLGRKLYFKTHPSLEEVVFKDCV